MNILEWFINQYASRIDIIRIGCAQGADEEFYHIVRRLAPTVLMEFYPCEFTRLRWAMRACRSEEIVHPVRPPLERNRTMVDASTYLVAGVKHYVEQQRSGTWATVRYARKRQVPYLLVYPDGSKHYTGARP